MLVAVEALALTNLGSVGELPYAQVKGWATEVWKAACGFDGLAIPLHELSRIFREVASRVFPAHWRRLRGTVTGAALELRRIRWSFAVFPNGEPNPFALCTDLGDELCA